MSTLWHVVCDVQSDAKRSLVTVTQNQKTLSSYGIILYLITKQYHKIR